MTSNYEFTEVELKTVEEARRLLGSHLSEFLLSGLGETNITHCRAFTASSTSSHSKGISYRFEIINESQQGLPIKRDPLIFAALIELLWERQPLDGKVLFRESAILDKLQWPVIPELQMLVKQAVERYLMTVYYLIDPTVPEEELLYGRYAGFRRLLIGYETTSILLPIKRTVQQRLTRIQFLPEFIYDVISERKYFLGLELQRLRDLQQISC